MPDLEYFNRKRPEAEKENPIVTDAEPEFNAGRLKFDDVADTGGEVVIDSLEYPHRRFTVACPELRSRRGQLNDDLLIGH